MSDVCPLHQRPWPCPCTRSELTADDLKESAAIGLWECTVGHRIVGPPTTDPTGGGTRQRCVCGAHHWRTATTIIPSRL